VRPMAARPLWGSLFCGWRRHFPALPRAAGTHQRRLLTKNLTMASRRAQAGSGNDGSRFGIGRQPLASTQRA